MALALWNAVKKFLYVVQSHGSGEGASISSSVLFADISALHLTVAKHSLVGGQYFVSW